MVSQGNAICVAASGAIDKLGDPASLADVARIGAKLAAIRDRETRKLAALKAAKDDEDGQARLIAALEARDKTLRAVVSAARKHDQAAATKALAAGQPLGDKASNAALDLESPALPRAASAPSYGASRSISPALAFAAISEGQSCRRLGRPCQNSIASWRTR